MSDYIEERDDGYWLAGSRVALDSIVYAFLAGETAEGIAQSFPALALEQVYGAIAFYLAHRETIDEYLLARRSDYEQARQAARRRDLPFYRKLASARHELKVTTA
jgi:uncharacterized protein (DUF433 family)